MTSPAGGPTGDRGNVHTPPPQQPDWQMTAWLASLMMKVDDPWPGDNGDWVDYENFVNQLLDDIIRLDMMEELKWDIWNEPDVDIFWKRPIEQWVELYVRTHNLIRERPEFASMEIMGPAMQIAVSENGIPPDQYSYHLLYGQDVADRRDIDLRTFNRTLQELLDQYDLPLRQVNVNEYAIPEEQVPSTSAWFISRFERYDTFGLRANWASGCQLHDFLANLVTKPGAPDSECGAGDYQPNGEWYMYAYYGTNMTGRRVASSLPSDGYADAFATVGDGRVRILAGVRQQTGTWQLQVNGLASLGFPESGAVSIQTYAFNTNGLYEAVDGPEDRGVYEHSISGGSVKFEIRMPAADVDTAFAFEFAVPG